MYVLQIVLSALLLNLVAAQELQPCPVYKIVGGQKVGLESYPYMASIQINKHHICGGTIVHESFILTTADCLTGYDPIYLKNLTVVVGTNKKHECGIILEPSDFFIPKNYNRFQFIYDVGLIKLKTPLVFNNAVNKLEIDPNFIEKGTSATLLGWGRESTSGAQSNELKKLDVTITFENCQFRNLHVYEAVHIGAAKGENEGGCFGDGGSPLVANNKIIGIFSFMSNPCALGVCDVYTRISAVASWINQTIEKYL